MAHRFHHSARGTTTMRLNNDIVTTQSNIDVEGEEVDFDPESFGPLMEVLSGMYSDIELAVIREYSANAYDSHVEAGVTDPIHVSLPTELNPAFVVRDSGLGLSKDAIYSIYGRYGKSTKRDDDNQIGGFGIGAKSAFALGHQFIVTGVKDGMKTVVLFALNERNVGEKKVIHHAPTDEPNGVTVSMAVEDVESFRQKAMTFFGKWTPGTVLVDGQTPPNVYDDAQQINDSVFILPRHEGAVWLKLGQVAYPVSNNILRKVQTLLVEREDKAGAEMASALTRWYNESALIMHAEIGKARVAPTREALKDVDSTVTTVADLIASIPATLQASVQETITACSTGLEAANQLQVLRKDVEPLTFNVKAVTWNGMPLPASVSVTGNWLFGYQKGRGSVRMNVTGMNSMRLSLHDAPKTLVIPDVDPEMATSIRRYAARFFQHSKYDRILLGAPGVTNVSFTWFNYDVVDSMTHEEYKAFLKEIPKDPRVLREPHYSFDQQSYDKDLTYRTPLSEIVDEGKDIVTFDGSAYHLNDFAWKALRETYSVVILGPTQTAEALSKHLTKMGADIKVVESPTEYMEVVKVAARKAYNPTDDEKLALGARIWLSENHHAIRSWLDAESRYGAVGEITNPLFLQVRDEVSLAKLVAADITKSRIAELEQAAYILAREDSMVAPYEAELPSFTDCFPLLSVIDSYNFRYAPDAAKQQALDLINNYSQAA